MRIGIDLDGVVADFNAGWTQLHRTEFASTVQAEMVQTWNGLDQLAGFSSMEEFWEWSAPKVHRRSIFRHLELLPDAIESLHELCRMGHDIVIITTKPEFSRADTFHWIADNDIPTNEVHLIRDKYRVVCDAYLDDGPHVLDDLVRFRSEALIGRFVRPWNAPLPGTIDVHTWSDFVAAVRERYE